MLVCWRWRNIGLESSRLWNTITVTGGSESLQLQLSRTGQISLHLFFTVSGDTTRISTAIPILVPHASRIRSIHLARSCRYPGDLQAVRPLFSVPLPNLRTLRLTATRGIFGINDGQSYDIGLADDALQSHPHELAILNIVPPPPSSSFWSQIRVLELLHHGHGAPISAGDVLAILRATPLVESLTVAPHMTDDSLMYPDLLGDITTQTSLNLIHLRHLTVAACREFASPLLQHIGAPQMQSLHLDIHIRNDGPGTVPDIFAKMLHSTHQEFLCRFQTIRVHTSYTYDEVDEFLSVERFNFREAGCHPSRSPAQGSFSLGVFRTNPQRRPFVTSFALRTLGSLFSGIPLQHVDLVEYRMQSDIANDLSGLLLSLPSVDTLSFSDCSFSDLKAALSVVKNLVTPTSGGANLKTLETTHAHFETPHEYKDVLDDLVSVARLRAEAGRPLDCVAVTVPYRNTDLDVRLLKLLAVHCADRVLLKDRYRPDDEPLVFSKEGEPAEDFELDAEIEYYLASVAQSPE
ncbi:hypothetical protein C8Q76DRAFT_795201 [Earliella scabrosa]|nr:hypothetical protein C8Q76DRAFT_795201 [Earliella scabrosa]